MKALIRILATGSAYTVLGTLGLLLAVSPGYASPVFPAAGLAVALALLFGNRVLPGIWIGSLAINLLVTWRNGTIDGASAASACVLAAGATTQAWAARFFTRRWMGDAWRFLETEKDIALFLAAAGPLSCLISATVGNATLYFSGLATAGEFFYSWWNWWLGDTLGVLIFAPMILIFMMRSRSPWKERQIAVAVPMLITLILVVSAFLGVTHWERTQIAKRIEDYGKSLVQLLDHRFVAHQEALASLGRLIEVTPDMTFEQFEYFTNITLKDKEDIFALSFNPRIDRTERRAFELSMAEKSPIPGFAITERGENKKIAPAADRPYYVTVEYIAPIEGNKPAIGFDINSEPIRRDAIDRAIASGKTSVTAPLRLVQENKERVGVLVMHPAFGKTSGRSDQTARPLIGFAVSVIKVDELIQLATQNSSEEEIALNVSDPLAAADGGTLYRSEGGRDSPAEAFAWRTTLAIADRVWGLEVVPTEKYIDHNRSWLGWGTGIVGLLFAALLQVLLMSMTGRDASIRQRVLEQTKELTRAKLQLEQLNDSLHQRVEESIAEVRKRDQALVTQGRMAAMGEMIGNIAHQWRQPLNALSILIANLQLSHENGELDGKTMSDSAETANRLIQKMSTTISDFRNFFNPDKERVLFPAAEQIRQVMGLVETAFKNNGIAIALDLSDDFTLKGFPNEYSQVLLNLLSNAKEAITEARAEPGAVSVGLQSREGMGILTVRDNGGGIPDAILEKIFEPYFTTKSKGTGIGLYMSKMIIEHNMNGCITARNVAGGAEFEISVPLAEAQP